MMLATALLFSAGCLPPPRLPAELHDAALNQPFRLNIGGTAAIRGEDLRIWFHSVPGDSRCPVDVPCLHAGDATVRLGVARGFEEQETVDVRVAPGAEPGGHGPYAIRVSLLEPPPRSGAPIDPADYVVTIVVARR